MKKGRVRLVRDDAVLKVKQRLFQKPRDKTRYVAQVTLRKTTPPLGMRRKEYWIGYYTQTGQQRGLGFFGSKKEVPKEFRAAFTGLDIRTRRRR